MYKSIEAIQAAFQKRNLKHSVEQNGDHWLLRAGVNGKASSYAFLFIKTDDADNDVAVRVFNVVRFPENRRDKGYEVLNKIQQSYRYVRLNMDGDGDVSAEYDFPMNYKNIGEGAIEILVRFTEILDKAYPEMMKAIWGQD